MAALPFALTLLLFTGTPSVPKGMARVDGGTYRPVFPPSPKETEIAVAPFLLDKTAVTNAQFAAFVQEHPKWRKDRVARVFADQNYLASWQSAADTPGSAVVLNAPVTRVSWFAAKAYCQWRGARLPSEAEWELAAAASETKLDARDDAEFTARILSWYAEQTPARFAEVGLGRPNAYGVHDLHGLIWEWVHDYGNTLLSSDSRNGNKDPNRFCGGAGATAGDKRNYAAFMRVAFRGSLRGPYTVQTLGFRCAQDVKEPRP